MPRDLTSLEARATLKTADLRGLRRRAGIKAATLAEGLGVPVWRVYEWERGRCMPSGRLLASYARVIAGLACHEETGRPVSGEEERGAA